MPDDGSPIRDGKPLFAASHLTASAPESRAESPSPSVSALSTGRTLKASTSYGRLSKLMGNGRARANSAASQTEASTITAFPDEGGVSSSRGRTTPDQRRTGRAAAASLLAADGRYKKYTQQVERALSTFESVNEWADFISFLSRLLKTLQGPSPSYNEIPRKITVAKRLAQCLNPALPSGVHQRALEVYSYIFGLTGEDGLRRDLQIWSSGLFPFFQFAATSVRPALIQIYETYYLPLGDDLRPAAKAFILALLPGLDEETGDFFDRILTLLTKVSDAISSPFFLQSIFLILITSPSARLSSLNYLTRRIPKPSSSDDPLAGEFGPDLGLLIRAFDAALEDDNVLVRRTAMDLLLSILKLDGRMMRAEVDETDRLLIMRFASGIVLRKDLSLTRRLYSWLLGSDVAVDAQSRYFAEYGLNLLAKSLLVEMQRSDHAPDDVDAERPYKIFIALLDKWEIGDALAPRMILPTLDSLKARQSAGIDQTLTITALFDVLDPYVVWKILHQAIIAEIIDAGSSLHTVDLTLWMIKSVPQHDEEVQTAYAPLLLLSVQEVVQTSAAVHDSSRQLLILRLLRSLVSITAASCFKTSPSPVTGNASAVTSAEAFYSSQQAPDKLPSVLSHLYPTSLSHLVDYLQSMVTEELVALKVQAYQLFSAIITAGSASHHQQVQWPQAAWSGAAVASLTASKSFTLVEAVVNAAFEARTARHLHLDFDASFDEAIVETLLRYLAPELSLYHGKAVDLLWRYQDLAPRKNLQDILCRRLSCKDAVQAGAARDVFGVLWRLTPDARFPGETLFLPIHLILDTLKSPDPVTKRSGETWMRCNLKSYFRMLDPLLYRLAASCSKQVPQETVVHGKPLKTLVYTTKVDFSLVTKLAQSLVVLFHFGGQGLSRTCSSTTLRDTSHLRLKESLTKLGHGLEETYLNAAASIFTSFLQSAPQGSDSQTSIAGNRLLQHAAAELLQGLLSRGDCDDECTRRVQSAVVAKLFRSIHEGDLDLQPKLLHLLHTAINTNSANLASASSASAGRSVKSSTSIEGGRPSDVTTDPRTDHVEALDPLLVQVVIDGISVKQNRLILQHWIDFILMTASCFQGPLQPVLFAIGDAVGDQLLAATMEISAHFDGAVKEETEDLICGVTDSTTTMLLAAYERLVTLAVTKTNRRTSAEHTKVGLDGGPGLFGYVSGVFTPDPNQVEDNDQSPMVAGLTTLKDSVAVLLQTWLLSFPSWAQSISPATIAIEAVLDKTRARCRRVLEKLFKIEPLEVLDSIVAHWVTLAASEDQAVCELVDALTPNAQRVVTMLSGMITGSVYEKSRRTLPSGHRSGRSSQHLLAFLELYIRRLEGPIAIQIWGVTFEFAREILSIAGTVPGRQQLFPMLRCITRLGSTVAGTSALEDRKYRRDLQDTFVKLLDALLTNLAKITTIGVWVRESHQLEPRGGLGQGALITGVSAAHAVHDFLAEGVIPNLRSFLNDNDRVASVCSNVNAQVVVPAIKLRQSNHELDPHVLIVLHRLSKVSSAAKSWRGSILDAFNDARFFRARPQTGLEWKSLVSAVMESDRDRLQEFLARIGAAPSANIFTNREAEMVSRSMNLRRLSFILYSSEKDHYLTQLPGIQEKLVDILRTTIVSPMVHSEVYLCLRVMLCRLSPQYLSNFWPVILAELLRVFEQTMDEMPTDGSDDLQLVLGACKFLDLLLVLQTEDFQIQQWLFVTDTTDAIYPSPNFAAESIMDRLAEILSEHDHIPVSSGQNGDQSFNYLVDKATSPRRPHLSGLRQISSISELSSFFSHASLFAFEGVYANVGLDWEAVEMGLAIDMFEGEEIEQE